MGFEFIILKFWLWFLVHVDNNGGHKAEGKREKRSAATRQSLENFFQAKISKNYVAP